MNMKPLWKGPIKDGITQSLLSKFVACRERFRLKIYGLAPENDFDAKLEYGNMWHHCEELHSGGASWSFIQESLLEYARSIATEYPQHSPDIHKWYRVCACQFPVYIDYWQKHPEIFGLGIAKIEKQPVAQEYTFRVPYELPSGRQVLLRGKFDAVDIMGGAYWLQENKTKSVIDEQTLGQQLLFDMQVMFYLVALRQLMQQKYHPWDKIDRIGGVRYNVIRRPLSGGKGTIVQHKPSKSNPAGESEDEYYARLQGIIRDDPASFFARWRVVIVDADIDKFELEFLIPILEQLCDWWRWIERGTPKYKHLHYRTPYGLWPMTTAYDELLDYGNSGGLKNIANLFPEL